MRPLLLLSLVLISTTVRGQVLDYSNRYKVSESIHGERIFEQPISIGPGVKVLVRTEVTSKGNGCFRLKNLEIRNFDQHDDAAVFQGDALRTEFIDVDRDGYRDLVVSGAVVYTLESVSAPPHAFTEPVVWIFIYDRRKDRFDLRFQNASFSLDLDGGPTTSPFYINQGKWPKS